MPFKFYSFVPGDDSELNYARPGSPPAFFSLPSPVSPRLCGNCIPSITAGAAIAASTAASTLQDRSLQPVDVGSHDLRSRVISALAGGNDVREFSLDCILDLNQEAEAGVVKITLDCAKDTWKNQDLSGLVDGFFHGSLQILGLCSALGKCLDCAQDWHFLVHVAFQHFDKEDGKVEGCARTLGVLSRFKAAGDPFTEEFFENFQSVNQQQLQMVQNQASMLQNLQLQKNKHDKKLRSSNPLWRNFEKAVEAQREVVHSMQIGTSKVNSDLERIKTLIGYLEVRIESLMEATVRRLRVEEIRRDLNSFRDKLDELKLRVDKCGHDVRLARLVVLQKIMGNLNDENSCC